MSKIIFEPFEVGHIIPNATIKWFQAGTILEEINPDDNGKDSKK